MWGDCLRNLTVCGSPEKAVAAVCVPPTGSMNRVHGKVPIGGMPGQRRHEGVDAAETFVVHPPSHSSVTLMHVHDAAQICEHRRCLCVIAFHVHANVCAECGTNM